MMDVHYTGAMATLGDDQLEIINTRIVYLKKKIPKKGFLRSMDIS